MEDRSKVVTYYPNQKVEIGLFKTCIVMLGNIIEGRELIWQMFKRDFFVVYRRSILGYFWIFLAPIMGIVSWVFMNYAGILHPGDMEMPYPVFVLLGSQMWGLFMSFYESSAETLNSSGGLLQQIRFDHEVLLINQVALALANFLMTLIIVFAVMATFGVFPPWQAIFFPLVALPLFFIGASIGLVVSVFSAVISDVSRIVGTVLGLVMYITPVIYTTDFDHPVMKLLVKFNPLSHLIATNRDILTVGRIRNFEP